jgi:hypothetical protein
LRVQLALHHFLRVVLLSAQSSAVEKPQQDIRSTVYQRGMQSL